MAGGRRDDRDPRPLPLPLLHRPRRSRPSGHRPPGDGAHAARRLGRGAGRDGPPPKAKPERPPRPPRELPASGNGKPAFRKQGAELLAAADRLGVARVAEVLGVRVGDLLPLFAGTVEVSRTALAKLRREVEGAAIPF